MHVRSLSLAALLLAAPLAATAGERGEHAPFQHVFLIMMENHGTDQIIGNPTDAPYINRISRHAGLALNYYGVTHPSLPNYLALLSGSHQGIWDDCKAGASVTCAPEEFVPGSGDSTDGNYLTAAQLAQASSTPHWFSGKTLVDQLEHRGLSWKAYFQSMPAGGHDVEYSPVIDGKTIKLYAQKHNPFEYFSNIRGSQERLAKLVPFESDFDRDLASGHLPAFVWVSPDQCHDMHGVSGASAAALKLPECGYPAAGMDHGAIALGDQFLEETVSKIMASPAWKQRSAIVIVWDEDDYSGFGGIATSPQGNGFTLGGARTPAMVLTSRSHERRVSYKPANHYSLLGTLQKLFGLGCLENTCKLREHELLTELFEE